MPQLPAIVVDVHSHVFNAEDLPIDGFIRKKLSPAVSLLAAAVTKPLDFLTQWAAEGISEKEDLLRLLNPAPFEATQGLPSVEPQWISDAELLQDLVADWERRGLAVPPPSPFESTTAASVDDALAAALASAPPAEAYELQLWIEEWDASVQPAGPFEAWNPVAFVSKVREAVTRFSGALRLVCRRRLEIAGSLAEVYPEVSLFVPALVDFSITSNDKPKTDIRQQITIHSLVAKLSIAGGLPNGARVFPFVGFDPYREVAETVLNEWDPAKPGSNRYVPYAPLDSTDSQDRFHRGMPYLLERRRPLHELEGEWHHTVLDLSKVRGGIDLMRHAVERGGFAGVKLYPPAGFFPLGNAFRWPGPKGEQLDAALRALYRYCETEQVPILAHAAFSNGFQNDWNEFAGPAGWELVFAEFPDLRLCLGHFGHFHGIGRDASLPAEDGWPWRFVALMDRYPHVYADVGNSEVPVSEEARCRYVGLLRALLGGDQPDEAQRRRRRRVMYGSDFWMNTLSREHRTYFTGFRKAMEEAPFDQATREAFFGRNALRFLGFTGDDDQPDFANRNRRRVLAFHGEIDPPAWLPRQA